MQSLVRDKKVLTLGSERGKVSYLLKTDTGMIRKVMSASGAMTLMKEGLLTINPDNPDYPITVDGKYFFPGTVREEGE